MTVVCPLALIKERGCLAQRQIRNYDVLEHEYDLLI